MASNSSSIEQKKLVPIEEALDRRMNHGIVEYLVKLQSVDKLQWVPWTHVYCQQLMDTEQEQQSEITASAPSSTNKTSSSRGIIDI